MNTKTIMESVSVMLGRFADLKGILFTTFAFSPDFFETYVLSIVIPECGRDTPAQVAATDEALDRLPVVVLYDPGGLVETEKRLSYEAIPVRLDDEAIFHPKIIYCFGTDFDGRARHELLVASANLTRQGWGRNVEVAFQRSFMPGSYLGWDLSRLLEHIARNAKCHTPLKPFLQSLPQSERQRWSEPGTRLIWRETHEEAPLSSYVEEELADGAQLTICSPYFGGKDSTHELLQPLAEEWDNLRIRLVPGPSQDGEYQITRADAEQILTKMPYVTWYRWNNCGEGNEYAGRLVHAKMYLIESAHGTTMAIGSHNFTKSGYGGRNIEASLWFPIEKALTLDLIKLSREELLNRCVETADELSEAPEAATAFCTVTVHWKEAIFEITDIIPENSSSLTVEVPWSTRRFPLKENTYRIQNLDEVASSLARSRTFFIRSDGEIPYRGIVSEVGWYEARPEPPLSSVDDILDAWASPNQAAENDKANAHLAKEEERKKTGNGYGHRSKRPSIESHEYDGDLFDNYFYRFRAIRLKRDRLISMDGRKTAQVNRVLFKSRTSVKALATRLEEQLSELSKDKDGIPALTLGLVTLWELEDFCAEAADRFFKLKHGINKLKKKVKKLSDRYTTMLVQAQETLDDPIRKRPPFTGIPPNEVIKWFRSRLKESEKWETP